MAGEYSGTLSNDGEHLGIRAANLKPIAEFAYNDKSPWPEEADGDGFSLVLRDPRTSAEGAANPASWRPSSEKGGSPGRSE